MKNLLIIYPHWHPANLAGVHRPRLIGNFLPEFGWHPIVLTVEEQYFEETPDRDFVKTFRDHFEVYRVKALPVGRIRLFGDIGLRAFVQLYKGAKRLIRQKQIDFIWIPVPSYYPALLGRRLYTKYKIPYGIDYIDPWVRDMKNYPSSGLRQRLALAAAKFLEPIAVKKADLISGVAKAYYADVLERNDPQSQKVDVAMPYGFDPQDHRIELEIPKPWDGQDKLLPFVYAGAFLPNSVSFFHLMFSCIRELRESGQWHTKIRLYFIGTGLYPGITLAEMAESYGLQDIVMEQRERIPFLNVLYYLSQAKGVMAIGSPSPHYTASKIFQSVLSENPVFAFFHKASTVVEILKSAKADQFLVTYDPQGAEEDLKERLKQTLVNFFTKTTDWKPNLAALESYSAKASARILVEGIETVLNR